MHFDLCHGKGNLEIAISLLDEKNKIEFSRYMNENTSFHPQNMFICKTEILKSYYEVIFPWLFKCEKIFSSKKFGRLWSKKNIWVFSGKISIVLVLKKL